MQWFWSRPPDDYEISLGFDPNDFDMDNDGISDMASSIES